MHGNIMCRCVCKHTKAAHSGVGCDRCDCAVHIHGPLSDGACDDVYRASMPGTLMAQAAYNTARALELAAKA
jgi:hypothetical protein